MILVLTFPTDDDDQMTSDLSISNSLYPQGRYINLKNLNIPYYPNCTRKLQIEVHGFLVVIR
jgi:hypothetical protein